MKMLRNSMNCQYPLMLIQMFDFFSKDLTIPSSDMAGGIYGNKF